LSSYSTRRKKTRKKKQIKKQNKNNSPPRTTKGKRTIYTIKGSLKGSSNFLTKLDYKLNRKKDHSNHLETTVQVIKLTASRWIIQLVENRSRWCVHFKQNEKENKSKFKTQTKRLWNIQNFTEENDSFRFFSGSTQTTIAILNKNPIKINENIFKVDFYCND